MQSLLPWLPEPENFRSRLRALSLDDPKLTWSHLVSLANTQLDFLGTGLLDKALQKSFSAACPPPTDNKTVRLAILASSTVDHLLPSIRVGALRHGFWCETYVGHYGQYQQDLLDPHSELGTFSPNLILFALDAFHLVGSDPRLELVDRAPQALGLLQKLWSAAADRFNCPIIQNTLLPVFHPVLGSNEHRLPSSPAFAVQKLNALLRDAASQSGVHLLALDDACLTHGIRSWHDVSLWHHAKQEIAPAAAPLYGELVGRLIGALNGRSYKCLVLDLDNTLWGGVIGDDGVAGISLGQNSAVGEAFVEFQRFALQLSRRGIILAICSKNDEANALAPFQQHTEMVLRLSDIACFQANWDDKATNLRRIAATLNIGLDSLVFADDNPFERNQVRAELPMVAVPELSDDPAFYSAMVSAAGYFEAISLTEEDQTRAAQYQENQKRQELLADSSNYGAYLQSLNMRLVAEPFGPTNLKRVAQLINKTNQFNLTTRRYTEEEVTLLATDPRYLTLQFRLIDSFGDSGIIAVVIGREQQNELCLDAWLMSCRVLGRQVEESTLNVIASAASAMGVETIVGTYLPTAKNSMVKDLYPKLGFLPRSQAVDGSSHWELPLRSYRLRETTIREEQLATQYATIQD